MKLILISALLLLTTLGCREGQKNEAPASIPILTSDYEVLDYTSTEASVEVSGQIALEGVNPLDFLEIYTNPFCQGSIVGTTTAQDFQLSGVELQLPVSLPVELYLSTANSSDCLLFGEFDPVVLEPVAPTFRQFSPESPSDSTWEPGIFGEAYPSSSSVSFFSDSTCTISVGDGSVEDFGSIGVQISLTPNALTSVYAKTIDPLGGESSCAEMGEFRHANSTLESPVFVTIDPASPNNTSNTPRVYGTSPLLTEEVRIYSDSGCLFLLNSGEPADFENDGIQLALPANTTNQIYAQAVDSLGNTSVCTFMTSYVFDTIGPANPSFTSVSPPSPTNTTTAPVLVGTGPSDSLTTQFFDSSLCLVQIGSGLTSAFGSTGLIASVGFNTTTDIYAKNFDAAGNDSDCILMTSYKHNTIPPEVPSFGGTDPVSPTNLTTDPLIFGTVATFTTSLDYYSDSGCVTMAGQGTTSEFEGAGVQVTLASNVVNEVYVRVWDLEGNVSACNFLGTYDHSNIPAPDVGFLMTFPASPTRSSTNPFVIGTADGTISQVEIFDDNLCTNSLGDGTRAQFASSGVQISVPANSTTNLFARATDVYGNVSSCSSLTTFIHNTVKPVDPVLTAVIPTSPNNITFAPTISGTTMMDPASQLPPFEVEFYDSGICVTKLGEGTPTDFAAGGIGINTYRNAVTSIYAKVFDEAGNQSNCVYMQDYTHDDLQPAAPTFLTASPGSPSFTATSLIRGAYGPSVDFLNRVSIGFYADSGCSTELLSADPTTYAAAGVQVTFPFNTTTNLYAQTVNEVGTTSNCTLLLNFRHYDLPVTNLTASAGFDGSVRVNWFPDTVSSAPLNYQLERSKSPNGPFTVLASGFIANTYDDLLIEDGESYFYRVYTSNTTGRSQYTAPAGITVSAPAAQQSPTMTANPGNTEVLLSWSGFTQNMSYKLYRATQEGGPFTQLPVTPIITTYTDELVVAGQTYYYYVVGTNPSGDSVRSPIASAGPKALPDAPDNFSLTPVLSSPDCGGGSGLKMSWTGSPYFDSYQVRATNSTGTLASVATNHYTYCGGAPGGNARFGARAVWGSGTTAETDLIGFQNATNPGLMVKPGDGEVLLEWTFDFGSAWGGRWPNETAIYRSNSPYGPFQLLEPSISGQSYVDTAVSNGTAYYYYVQNFVVGNSTKRYIGFPSQVLGASPAPLPSAPTNLVLQEDPVLGLKLDWQAPSHFNLFRVYSATSPGGPWSLVDDPNLNFRYGVTSTEGMNYYRVTAMWGTVESAPTNVVSYRRATISNLVSFPTGVNQVDLTWSDAAGLPQDYEVFRSTLVGEGYSSLGVTLTSDFTDTTVASDQGYYYKVQARFADATRGQMSAAVSAAPAGITLPTGISALNPSATSFQAHWADIATATQYEVWVSTLSSSGFVQRAITTTNNQANINSLIPQTEYFFFVRARVAGFDRDSSVASVTTLTPASTPIGTVKDGEINLSWVPIFGAVSYDLLRSTDAVNYSPVVLAHPTSSYLDTSVVNGTTYYYKLVVNYAIGSTTSGASRALTPGVVPLDPQNLTARGNGAATVALLAWDRVDGSTNYNVYRATSPGGPFTLDFATASTFDVNVSGLLVDTDYYFRVTARNGDVESNPSNVVGFRTGFTPPAPQAYKATAGSVTIAWADVTDADVYDLYRSEDDSYYEIIASDLASAGYSDASVTPSQTYFYKYQPKTAAGVLFTISDESAAVNIGVVPEIPVGLTANLTSLTEVELNWVSTPSVSEYEILRSTTSGSGYSSLGTVLAPATTFTDSTLAGGTSYFYVIRTINASRVGSPYSAEVGVRSVAGPSTLLAVNQSSGVDLTWAAVAGASSYNVYRSQDSGGPYGYLANSATLAYTDTSAEADLDYYYIARAVFADGEVSDQSPEASLTRAGVLDLEVPIELTDLPLASDDSESREFLRTQTSLDTDDYDGTVTYRFEIVGRNTDSGGRAVRLKNSLGAEVAAITIPNGTSDETRFSGVFTPTAGQEVYTVEIEQTTSGFQVEVYQARVLVHQVGATKTRLYFPLMASDGTVLNGDGDTSAFSTNNQGFVDIETAMTFTRDTNQLQSIRDYNAWEIEAIVSSSNDATGSLRFLNRTTSTEVPQTWTNFKTSTPQMARIAIDEGVPEFDSDNEGHEYQLQLACELDCSLGEAKIHKAGLWVKLENLTRAIVVQRNMPIKQALSGDGSLPQTRVQLDLSRYTGEQVFFEAEASDGFSDSGDVVLQSHSADSGSAGLVDVFGSQLNFDFNATQVLRSGPLTLPSGESFVTGVNSVTGNLDLHWSTIIIEVNQP